MDERFDTEDAPAPEDPIVAEVRATRAALSSAVGDDIEALYAQLKALEAAERAAGRAVIAPPRTSAAA